jgi:hypothetical protein
MTTTDDLIKLLHELQESATQIRRSVRAAEIQLSEFQRQLSNFGQLIKTRLKGETRPYEDQTALIEKMREVSRSIKFGPMSAEVRKIADDLYEQYKDQIGEPNEG